jgi:nucleoside-diphosphate-sugar epimerase
MIRRGRYFHVGKTPRYRHMGYVGNVCHQYIRLLEADSERIHRRVFYVADYDPISVQEWSNLLQRSLGGPPIRTLPASVGKLLAKSGDVVNALGWRSFPFNSFRLTNVLSEYTYDLSPTRDVCGPLPFTPAEGAERTAQWFLAAEPTA